MEREQRMESDETGGTVVVYDIKNLRETIGDLFPKLYNYGFSLSRGDREIAYDSVMNAIKKVLQHIQKNRKIPENIEAYLIRSIRNSHNDIMRRSIEEGKFMSGWHPPENIVDETPKSDPLLRRKITFALSKLSPKCREILTLVSQKYSYLEISAIRETHINTVRSQISRCRNFFKDILGSS